MELFFDCLPCLLKQALDAARMTSDDTQVQENIMNDSIQILSNYKEYRNSPDLARAIHKTIKVHTGNLDPYFKIKERDLKAVNRLYPLIREYYERDKRLLIALKLSAIGNSIDSALNHYINLEECFESEMQKTFAICDIESFEEKLKKAKSILIIGDNTGETIFDRLLLESLNDMGIDDIYYAVRSLPIINDATVIEAYASGLDQYANILSTGCDAPGTILKDCDDTFLKQYHHADIIISKGQGNYEALSEEKEVFFLLKAKCMMISKKLNVELNDYIFKYSRD